MNQESENKIKKQKNNSHNELLERDHDSQHRMTDGGNHWLQNKNRIVLELTDIHLLGLKSKQADVTAAFFMLLLQKMRRFMWRCLLVSNREVQMESSRSSVSRKLFVACIKVLVPFGNILLKAW